MSASLTLVSMKESVSTQRTLTHVTVLVVTLASTVRLTSITASTSHVRDRILNVSIYKITTHVYARLDMMVRTFYSLVPLHYSTYKNIYFYLSFSYLCDIICPRFPIYAKSLVPDFPNFLIMRYVFLSDFLFVRYHSPRFPV